jgi:hypothetical protein
MLNKITAIILEGSFKEKLLMKQKEFMYLIIFSFIIKLKLI